MPDGEQTLYVTFGAREALKQETHVSSGGLFIPLPDPPPEPLRVLRLELRAGAEVIALEAMVVQVMGGTGLALTFEDPAAAVALEPLFEAARMAEEGDGKTEVAWSPPETDGTSEETDAEPDEETRQTLQAEIRGLSFPRKMQWAMHGGRPERMILMKDTNKTIHTFVMQNKKITLDEVRWFAGFRQANPEALKTISLNRIWMQNPRILPTDAL